MLYDGSTLPAAQGWFAFVPLPGTQSLNPGFVEVDTTQNLQAGFFRIEPLLSSSPGFRLDFDLRVVSEGHIKDDRAGLSLIAIDENKHGIELGFWSDQIFAQNLGFTHGEQMALDTTSALTSYSLIVLGDDYSLTANNAAGVKHLSGKTRFYNAPGLFGGDVPYKTAHALFIGDDTTSAAAKFDWHSMRVTSVPEPQPYLFGLVAAVFSILSLRARALPR